MATSGNYPGPIGISRCSRRYPARDDQKKDDPQLSEGEEPPHWLFRASPHAGVAALVAAEQIVEELADLSLKPSDAGVIHRRENVVEHFMSDSVMPQVVVRPSAQVRMEDG